VGIFAEVARHISATDHPFGCLVLDIHFAFGSVVGLSGRRIECLYFRFRSRSSAVLYNSESLKRFNDPIGI